MNIVLSILAVLGWLLLIAFLVILFVLCILLFCPVRYSFEGEWLEVKWAKAKLHWLLHLLGVKISYNDNLIEGEFWIFWKKKTFSIDLSKKEEEVESFEIFKDKPKEKVIGTETLEELRSEVPQESEEIEVDTSSNDSVNVENDSVNEENVLYEKSESIISKIKGIIERIREVYGKIKKILSDEKNQETVTHIKNEIVYLIKILIPKKSKIDAVFSTGSPDTTGQLFGILACFPSFYHKNWKLLPDFEADEAYFKGSFWGKGKLYGYQIVGIILRILFDKNCRRLYTMINKFLAWMKKDEKSEVK